LLHQLKATLIAFGPLGVFLLAALDSCGVPLPGAMDVSLVYVAWHSPHVAYWTALMAVLGSLCGNVGLFLASRHGVRRLVKPAEPGKPQRFRKWFDRYGLNTVFIPALNGVRRLVKAPEPGKPQRFREWFDRYGLITVFIPALIPIPLPMKPFVISAGVMRTPFSQFFAVVAAARLIRYFGEAYLGVRMGQDAQGFLMRNGWTLTAVALALGFVLFALVWLNDRRRAAAL
jgi:membrane protein DedA with SNARE-associated domain